MIRCLCHIRRMTIRAAVLIAVCLMCACTAGRLGRDRVADPAAYAALPPSQRPYKVFGVWYYPVPSAEGFVEEGRASWYGPGFHGRQTSSGECYDMHALTAAHKTLPLGTHVKVTRTDNGKSVVVRLNDRGPFVDERIIDLSRAAAQTLDMIGSGTAPVRIEALQNHEREQPGNQHVLAAASTPGDFTVFVGDYAIPEEAEAVSERFAAEGRDVRILRIDASPGAIYRVCVGTFSDLIEAQISAAHLREAGYAHAHVAAAGRH